MSKLHLGLAEFDAKEAHYSIQIAQDIEKINPFISTKIVEDFIKKSKVVDDIEGIWCDARAFLFPPYPM